MSSRESKSGSDVGSEDDNVLGENSIGGFDNDARKSASAISPSLDPLLNDQGDAEIETKSARRRRKAQEKKGLAGGSTMSSSSMAEQQKTIEMLMEMNMKLLCIRISKRKFPKQWPMLWEKHKKSFNV